MIREERGSGVAGWSMRPTSQQSAPNSASNECGQYILLRDESNGRLTMSWDAILSTSVQGTCSPDVVLLRNDI